MADNRFSLDSFRSKIFKDSLARTNRFEVEILPPPGLTGAGVFSDTVSLYCEQAVIPQLSIGVKQLRMFGPSHQRPTNIDYGGDGMSLTFHVDRDMRVRKFFENWMHIIVDPNNFTVSYQEDYISQIKVRQLDENNNVTHEIAFYEAFPRNINVMELNHSAQNQTHRINVLFAFRRWERLTTSTTMIDTPLPVQYPGVPIQDNRAIQYYRE